MRFEAIGALAAQGGDPIRRDAIFRIASMTKPVTAAAAMMLMDEAGCGSTTPSMAEERFHYDPVQMRP